MTFYRPGFQRTQLQFRLDNDRVPGNHLLMLDNPVCAPPEPAWDEPEVLSAKPEIDRVFSFDLTDSDAIVIDA